MPGGLFQGIPQVFFLRATLPPSLLKHFLLFQSSETHIFRELDISLDTYFSFASLVDFLGLEISVWKFWPKIPLTLCTKLWGPVAPPKLFCIFFFHILQVWFYYQNEGVSRSKIPFLFWVNHHSPRALVVGCEARYWYAIRRSMAGGWGLKSSLLLHYRLSTFFFSHFLNLNSHWKSFIRASHISLISTA